MISFLLQVHAACLSPSSWPDDENQRALFGDQQVVNLAKLCHVNVIEEFREYKNNIRRIAKTLQALFHRICLSPILSPLNANAGFHA